ncbi:histidine phosphatase family protein [Auraticoccus sp. F435]|uniref:Histidine phosphatase family protein n=1 Tax=Auraticoccus cholistanensis TaxID=2656650 RepID=A0A6A9UTA9_9ACTN|nr:histidine phosphatase family protein [Auraticoccus cholistanensis]MVA76166.1 histidine phosphatase family protein [Auraticoccus cholistanensis]
MTDLYLVRHGQTEWSRDGRHTSATDLELTEVGRREAERLRDRLADLQPGLVLSSPRRRALDTARIAGFPAEQVEVTEDLAEWGYGDYEGITSEEIRERDPGWTVWTHPTPGGETPAQVRERLGRVVERVRGSGLDRVLCFGHGHSLRALTLIWLELDLERGESFPMETGTLSVLGERKGRPALVHWNS